jgi:ribulose kinase
MRLLATVLQMPVIIPPQPSAAVVLGSAMLGRFAHDLTTSRSGKPILTQNDAEEARKEGGKLWDVMVAMTKPGVRIEPRVGKLGEKEKKLLEVKYKVFRESVEIQKKWRGMIADAVKDE